jgi:hypothetical protein
MRPKQAPWRAVEQGDELPKPGQLPRCWPDVGSSTDGWTSNMSGLFRFPEATGRDPAIDAWLTRQVPALGALARTWFLRIRDCGSDVRELMHDGCPTACVEDAAFAYVGVFTAHVNVGFFHGAELEDPTGLLEGTGKRMRHVKVKPGADLDARSLDALIRAAYVDVRRRLAAKQSMGVTSSLRERKEPGRRPTRG